MNNGDHTADPDLFLGICQSSNMLEHPRPRVPVRKMSRAIVSFELVEINPVIDLHNATATLGVELILSGMGKKIL